ncbi:efflux RND transporter periplasmic adaptor subunit [Algiphilus sp. W345]|uniref:Efflux RND transporter periplasmic adaptor subunit n=1 Tax=Banduia mediterranea TaxID=3075609 RepID=A0ABU2WET7_9GAMM|nr:efflux RND transporter periplasmic adaptor subunit [Algiphilus sp. W345]MDT0496048.1 efflux RND transporter periplasmic adaptor subunit [Algiphilus sp. W345]
MSDKSELLASLKIDRGDPPSNDGHSRVWMWGVLALLLIALIIGGTLVFGRDKAIEVRSAVALAASSGAAAGSVLDASGYVVARRQATVSAKITGKVTKVLIEEGQHVQAGEIMAELEDATESAQLNLSRARLEASRSELRQLQVQLDDAQRTLRRNRELAERKLVSQSLLDTSQAEAEALEAQLATARENVRVAQRQVDVSQRNLDETTVRAPFAGVVTVKAAQVGEIVSPLSAGGGYTRTGIGTIVDMDSLEIEVDVNENFINRVQSGQKTTATLNAYPEWKIPARVIAVIPTADRSKATIKVRVEILEKDARILPEMGVRVAFLGEEQPQGEKLEGVLVDAAAIKNDGGAKVVYLIRGDSVERRAVTTGIKRGERVQVTAGLSPGNRVALGPLDQLSDGSTIRIGE